MSDFDDLPSKTRVKKEMNALQDLGLRLTELAPETLRKAGLPEEIVAAVADYRKIRSNGALKRQAQYIGRLMREASDDEVQSIHDYLAVIDGESIAHNAQMQRLEQWRNRLLAEDDALTAYLDAYPDAPSGELRTLIRNARKEAQSDKPPKAYRALFQLLKSTAQEAE
ncbi:MAG: ribosome biogenesis factor YjgA [Neisseria sp.]|nr:ribosome biogenesis factor YjgA [Neisseria sp.]